MRPQPLHSLVELDPDRMARSRVALVVEDSDEWAVEIELMLQEAGGWTIGRAVDSASALAALAERRYDLLILDRNLDPDDGLELLGRLRRSGLRTPALLLTTMGTEAEIVQGLRSGGDDYVVKPPRRGEFLARVEALMRRADDDGLLVFGTLEVNFRYNHILNRGEAVPLKQRERSLLAYLALRDPEPVSMAELLGRLWRYRTHVWPDGEERQTNPGGLVDVTFSLLRKALDEAGIARNLIVSHPATMTEAEFSALRLEREERVLARDLTKSWSLDARVLQGA